MSITFGKAKEILAQYHGRGGKLPDAPDLDSFVIKVLKYLLISGSPDSEKKFTFYAVDGCFTAPPELKVPLKVQINGRVGTVGSKWFEFHSGNDFMGQGCMEAADILFEEPNTYYTAYDLPAGGAQVGVQGMVDEDCDAYLIVAGEDATGRRIFTNHKGGETDGELLEIRKNTITWSNVSFATISSVVKTRTKGYTPLYWRQGVVRGFLADYSPIETEPRYRRFRLSIPNCPSPAKISVLGRVGLKDYYSDNDRIPFDNEYLIEVAGQQVNANYNERDDEAIKKDNYLQSLTNRDAVHKRMNNGQPLDVFHATSGATVQGIRGRR